MQARGIGKKGLVFERRQGTTHGRRPALTKLRSPLFVRCEFFSLEASMYKSHMFWIFSDHSTTLTCHLISRNVTFAFTLPSPYSAPAAWTGSPRLSSRTCSRQTLDEPGVHVEDTASRGFVGRRYGDCDPCSITEIASLTALFMLSTKPG